MTAGNCNSASIFKHALIIMGDRTNSIQGRLDWSGSSGTAPSPLRESCRCGRSIILRQREESAMLNSNGCSFWSSLQNNPGRKVLPRARAIPEVTLRGVPAVSKRWDRCARKGPFPPAADINHLALRGLDMEIAEWTDRAHDITRLETEHKAGTNPRLAILARWGVAIRTLKRSFAFFSDAVACD